MLLRPEVHDLRLIGFYLGKVLLWLGLLMLVPATVALALEEWNSASALLIGASLCVIVAAFTHRYLRTRRPLTWTHGMVVVALSWLVGAAFAAVPLHLSGRFSHPLASLFEGMAGVTTTGMSVMHDLDHAPVSVDLFRHLLQGAGGLGILIVVLSLFASGAARVATLYTSEAREERVMPNVIRTSRFIFLVTASFLTVGTAALVVALLIGGSAPARAILHAVNLALSSFATGGFATMQASIAYYHSATIEVIVALLMVAGTLSFGLHLALWRGDPRTLLRHLELRTLAVTTSAFFAIVVVGLLVAGTFDHPVPLLRKGFFTLISAVSSTGHQVNAGTTYLTDWGVLAPAAVVGAMAVGGMASSTAGGIKAFRIGITVKALLHDIRRILLPESALTVTTYHAGSRQVLRDETARAATTVLLLFIASYLAGALAGLAYGEHDITQTLFESVSVGSNSGVSIGVVTPDMPRGLMAVYVGQMWLGRLEFVAVFVLVGYVVAMTRGRVSS